MKYIFLNPISCAGKAPLKWQRVQAQFPDAQVISDSRAFDWQNHEFPEGALLISAGGDGTLHHLVNTLIQHRGVEFLQKVKIGHIGLGSNNSFLRPYSECEVIADIPMRVSSESVKQDLLEVQVGDKTFFCIANASLGFLARANQTFNTSKLVHVLKKYNSDVADVVTFFRTLTGWQGLELEFETPAGKRREAVTNMHFMKRPFYAADMGFEEEIQPDSGKFHLNILRSMGRMELLKRFSKVLISKNFSEGRHELHQSSWIDIESPEEIPFEMDGEVHWGKNFKIRCLKAGVQLCR